MARSGTDRDLTGGATAPSGRGPQLDALDRKILDTLLSNGRATWAQLAAEIGLSAPSTAERVRKLEESGCITGYAARVDPVALGYSLLAFVALSVDDPADHPSLLQWVQEAPEVQECHIIAGEHDYLLKVRARDPQHLERFLRERLRSLPGVLRTTTTIVLLSREETASIPPPDQP